MQPLGTVSVRGLSLVGRGGKACGVASAATRVARIALDICFDQWGIHTWCHSHQQESMPSYWRCGLADVIGEDGV